MTKKTPEAESFIRYEPDERAPHPAAAAMAAQIVVLIVAPIMVTPLVVAQAAGLDAEGTAWMVFAALIAGGVSTWLQALKSGPVGSGYTLFVGSNVAFVSIAVAALQSGGLPLLGMLAASGAMATFAFTRWMPLMRRFLTPAVGGTVLLLMALSVGPVLWKMLGRPGPLAELSTAHGLVFLITLISIVLILLFTRGLLRLWAPLLGVVLGTGLAWAQGLLDTQRIVAAPWIGLPHQGWPGLDLSFGPAFWALLPAFVLVSLVGCMETFADGVSVQRISHRSPRPIDFRSVQGAINADGVGSAFAGLLGTVPNTVYSTSLAVVEITGFASRRVGLWGGLFMIGLAFSPKLAAAVASLPPQVTGAYLLVLVVLIFAHGIRLVTEEGLGFEVGLAVCMGFWIGFGAQSGGLLNSLLPGWLQTIFTNGTTVGGLTAIVLMSLRRGRLGPVYRASAALDPRAIMAFREGLSEFARRMGWDRPAENRLHLAVEEGVLFLCEGAERRGVGARGASGQILIRLVERDGEAEVELVSGPTSRNAEAAIAALTRDADKHFAEDLSIRLLSRIAKDVRHLQYRQGDYVLFRVDSAA